MEKIHYKQLDVLRAAACFMVVLLHTAAQGFYVFAPYWRTALLYNAFSRAAVPIMFMVSGACLIPKEEPMGAWLWRLFRRTVFPYVCWSFIYLTYTHTLQGGGNIFVQPPYFHLGFILHYFAYQLALPMLRAFWNNPSVSRNVRLYVIIASLGYGCLTEFIPPLLGCTAIGFQLSCIPYYSGMALLGAYLMERPKHSHRAIMGCGYVACSLITVALTCWKSSQAGQPLESFLVYSSPFTIMGAACLFYCMISGPVSQNAGRIAGNIASVSFAVYLMHPLFLDILGKGPLCLKWDTWFPVLWIPVFALIVAALSVLLAVCFRRGANYFFEVSH